MNKKINDALTELNNEKSKSLDSSICYYNEKSDKLEKKWWIYLIENKLIYCLLVFFTFGIFYCYEKQQTKKLLHRGYLISNKKIQDDVKAKKEWLFKNNLLHSDNYINYVNNSYWQFNKHKNLMKNHYILFICNLLLQTFLTLATCGLYFIYVVIKFAKYRNYKEKLSKTQEYIQKKQAYKALMDFKSHDIQAKETQTVDEFNYEHAIVEALKFDTQQKQKTHDFFTYFLFYFSYIILSLVTLGIFPIYVLIKKYIYKQDYNFFNNFLEKEILDKNDFNNSIAEISSNMNNNFDYASALVSSISSNFSYSHNSLFKTNCFKDKQYKFFTLLLLNILSCGIFAIYFATKCAFNNSSINKLISQYHAKKNNMWLENLKNKLKPLYDFQFDVKIAVYLSSHKIFKVISNVNLQPTSNDKLFCLIRYITSPVFKWLFTLFLLLFVYALLSIWFTYFPFQYDSWLFITAISSFVIFVLMFSYHIFLLF